jgi:hypothetical protein
LEKPNNPTNCSLWQLVNSLASRVESQEDIIAKLRAGLIQLRERLSSLEMSSTMLRSWVQTLEDVMEQDPPSVDLTSEDLEYQDVDDSGAMMVEDSEDERDQENVPPPVLHVDTPHSAPVAPAIEVVNVNVEGEDDMWYILPIMHHQIHPLDKYSTIQVNPLPEYVKDVREDERAGPH